MLVSDTVEIRIWNLLDSNWVNKMHGAKKDAPTSKKAARMVVGDEPYTGPGGCSQLPPSGPLERPPN